MQCIICGSDTVLARRCTSGGIRQHLCRYFRGEINTDIEVVDYSVMKCKSCGLEFADPMTPGSEEFYHWITLQSGYYPQNRWEFGEIEAIVRRAAQVRPIRILDVGCGSGDFLRRLSDTINVEVHGLDTTPKSIDACRAKGIQAYCCDIETFRRNYPSMLFDYVVSFHCIEHVPDPKRFVAEMQSLLTDGGRLLVSAPLSPMSFETSWHDPLNYPPHHLSRFSVASIQALARTLGLTVEVDSEPLPPLIVSAVRTIKLRGFGPSASMSKRKSLAYIATHLPTFVCEIRRQYRHRQSREASVRGDTFLASFGRPARMGSGGDAK